MRKIRGTEAYAALGPKECWHPYGLQMLRPEQFTTVVNSILRGEDRLLPVARGSSGHELVFQPLLHDH
jgi:hypothetical protein